VVYASNPLAPKTYLAPPFRCFAEKTAGTNGILVLATDGHVDDEDEVVAEAHRLVAEISSRQRPSLKCQSPRAIIGKTFRILFQHAKHSIDLGEQWHAAVADNICPPSKSMIKICSPSP